MSVVFPLPRNPVTSRTGIRGPAESQTLLTRYPWLAPFAASILVLTGPQRA
jgi:hypothetical protein